MTDCVNTEVRDALPDLVHGRLSELDAATMAAHVESCADCRAEVALLREVRAAAPPAPRMDAARIAAAIPLVLMTMPVFPPRQRDPGMFLWRNAWRFAAAAVVVAVGAWAITGPGMRAPADVALRTASAPATVVDEATPVSGARAAVQPAPASSAKATDPAITGPSRDPASLSLDPGVQDLSDAELEQLLSELDGIDSIPSADPQSVTLSVDDIEGGA
ncbi:MAG: zf-HC2 domain-containing protein [Gemmatimonadales bacterium]